MGTFFFYGMSFSAPRTLTPIDPSCMALKMRLQCPHLGNSFGPLVRHTNKKGQTLMGLPSLHHPSSVSERNALVGLVDAPIPIRLAGQTEHPMPPDAVLA